MNEEQHFELEDMIIQLRQENRDISLEEMRYHAVEVVMAEFGPYVYPLIRALPLDQVIREKSNLREMGCDGGFDPIPPPQIEFDSSLNCLERFTALIRAAIQFYAYSGPAEVKIGENPYTRWGFVHLDQTGEPNTKLYGLHQDMVRYLTDKVCTKLGIGIQTWMQRGNSSHIQMLVQNTCIGEDLLLRAFFGEEFPNLFNVVNGSAKSNLMMLLGELSDFIDNGSLCEFPPSSLNPAKEQFTQCVRSIGT